jgi:hypothetical protein
MYGEEEHDGRGAVVVYLNKASIRKTKALTLLRQWVVGEAKAAEAVSQART